MEELRSYLEKALPSCSAEQATLLELLVSMIEVLAVDAERETSRTNAIVEKITAMEDTVRSNYELTSVDLERETSRINAIVEILTKRNLL